MNIFCPNSISPLSLSHTLLFSPFPFSSLRTKNYNNHRLKLFSLFDSSFIQCSNGDSNFTVTDNSSSGLCEESEEFVEVIAIGSRKDALLDFCSASPFLSPALRFWNILGSDSEQVEFQQRIITQGSTSQPDSTPRTVENLSAGQSSCKAVILVGSAAYGSDHIRALDVLGDIISGDGIVVGIILKPFCFEGQRRQDEVKDLVYKLQKQADFCIVLDTDALLENDHVTLDEALRTSNSAVLMAMNAISIIIAVKHIKLLNTKHNSTRELQFFEFKEILKSFKEARMAFGSGYDVNASLLQAVNACPFLSVDAKDLDGVIICIFAISGATESCDTNAVLQIIRRVIGWNSEIIVSVVHEPSLEPDQVLTTVIAFGYAKQQPAPRNGIFSSLGQHFPFIINMFKKRYQQPINSEDLPKTRSDVKNVPATGDMPYENSLSGTTDDLGVLSDNQLSVNTTDEELFSLSGFSGEREFELQEVDSNSSSRDINAEGSHIFKRELLREGILGLERPTDYGVNLPELSTSVDTVRIFKLPVGVKHLAKSDPFPSKIKKGTEWRVDDNEEKQQFVVPSVSWSGFTEAGINTFADFTNIVSASSKRKYNGNPKKQGGLSVRAASMLESERDSQKKWSRVVKMNYRGGIYKGRAQGGLPEGKGSLLLGDGSIYEGMWRYGKRSGLGTFYFNNGDVYQGSWRDDVMHGKGWLYFRTGDRWFVNFWKGKANGEGRFYSNLGDVFFGHFKEGWRHGRFLRINVDGTRSEEVWDEGVLVSEKQLDPNAEVG